jgi:apolipoprotein N-acyltransferase
VNTPPVIDIVGLLVFISAFLFSAEVASVVGPYLVIVIASAIGASFAVARREKTTRAGAVLFFARVVGLAVLLTVGVAAVVNIYRPDLSPRVVITPIALIIGFIGDDWGDLLSKVTRVIYGAIDLFRGSKG